jgi:hypothetical protein
VRRILDLGSESGGEVDGLPETRRGAVAAKALPDVPRVVHKTAPF